MQNVGIRVDLAGQGSFKVIGNIRLPIQP